jgi:hypothetical protein
MTNLMRACALAALVFFLCIGGTSGQFGYRITNSSPENGMIVEDFASAGSVTQTPVQMGYSVGGDDTVYLHIGEVAMTGSKVGINDIRLTISPFGPPGSKVGVVDGDRENDLRRFSSGLPRIVFLDDGTIIGQFDLDDPVYIKVVTPFDKIGPGDVRLDSPVDLPGTRVLDFDPDNGASCSVLHSGPSFNLWLPGARGVVRFYNANGNLYTNPGALFGTWPSPPIYDAPDVVYFDVSSPTAYPRNFGYLTPNAIRMSN